MSKLSRARFIVVGAGVLGLSAALALERRGATVTVLDPDAGAGSASAVAAGMIAPGLEAALEDVGPGRATLHAEAAAIWPGYSQTYGLGLVADGADWLGPADLLAERLAGLGIAFERTKAGLHLPGEARLDAPGALRRMASALVAPIVRRRALRIGPATNGVTVLTDEGTLTGDAVVLAAGWSVGAVDGAGGLARAISPVKGQAIVLEGAGVAGVRRTTRGPGCYLVPSPSGLIVGATMEPGRADLAVDPAAVEALRAEASDLAPELAGARVVRAWAGVRGATPDGLPMVGATSLAGVFAALAPRRNGWLLAPLAGEILAAAAAQQTPPPLADAFRPDRFDPA